MFYFDAMHLAKGRGGGEMISAVEIFKKHCLGCGRSAEVQSRVEADLQICRMGFREALAGTGEAG